MEFESETQTAAFHSPLEEFELTEVEVEVREDPLTGRQARIVPDNFLTPEVEPDISPVVEDDEGCFFCPGTVGEATPEYPGWVGTDRGSRGEATSFPNLNPYGAYSNVVVLTEDHYVPLDELGADRLEDGLAAALDYVGAVMDHDDDAAFASVNMNFLRPAGSSIVHPHMQTLIDDRATNEARARIEAAREYHEDRGSTYWADLVAAERGGERHLGTTGEAEWLAPFAPKHHRHVQGIVPHGGVPGPGDPVVADLAAGLAGVLDHYADAGLNSFNLALWLADDPAVPPVLDVIARSVFEEFYWSDSPFFVTLHDEGVVDVAPEDYAAEAGAFL